MPWLSPRRLSFLSVNDFFHRLQRRWNSGYETHITPIRNLDSALVELPIEILLMVADLLPMYSKLLLSLSSKRLRAILSYHLDLKSITRTQKLQFLLQLEKDLPDYLTCRSCIRMFRWRPRKDAQYQCPRGFGSKRIGYHACLEPLCRSQHVSISQEIIDLILRACYRGSQHGILASSLNHACNGWCCADAHCLYRRFEGRLVAGEFFLARSYVYVVDPPRIYCNYESDFLSCKHNTSSVGYEIARSLREWDGRRSKALPHRKCNICATDVKVRLLPAPADCSPRVEVKSWQKFGAYESYARIVLGTFNAGSAKIDDSDLARRDLERDFDSSI